MRGALVVVAASALLSSSLASSRMRDGRVRWEAEGGGRWPHFYRWRGGRFPFCFLTHTLFEEGLLFIFIFFCAVAWFISRCIFFVERAVYVTPTTKLVERERERGVERPVPVRVRTAGEWNGPPWTPHARGASFRANCTGTSFLFCFTFVDYRGSHFSTCQFQILLF